jgi:hypothetical protein
VDPRPDREAGDPDVAGGDYVTFVDARSGRRSSYTVEGYLADLGDFSAGAVRAQGWRRVAAKVLVLALLLPIALTVLRSLWTLLWLLLGH